MEESIRKHHEYLSKVMVDLNETIANKDTDYRVLRSCFLLKDIINICAFQIHDSNPAAYASLSNRVIKKLEESK